MDSMAMDLTPGLPVLPCLNSLPNELLNHIFDSYDTSYILPPLNRRLLPFHQSQLFRDVVLTQSKYDRFKVAIDSNEKLKEYVRAIELEFRPLASRKPVQISPTRQELSTMLASLPNLESFTLRARPRTIDALFPSIQHFKSNPKLMSILAKPWVADVNRVEDWRDAFDCLTSPYVVKHTKHLSSLVGDTSNDLGPLVIEIKQQKHQDASTFALRYCAHNLLRENHTDPNKNLAVILGSLPITTLEVTAFEPGSSFVLSILPNPSALQRLSLIALSPSSPCSSLLIGMFASCTNLQHLTFSGNFFPSNANFYETLSQLPLISLELGPSSIVDTQALIHFVSRQHRPNRMNLKLLILNNIYSARADVEEDSELDEWAAPVWTETCSKEGVEKLRIVAKGLGIETAGMTFLGVDIEDSETYQEALRRSEEEESEEESDEDEEDEYEREMEEREYEAEMCSDHHEDEHEAECGCHRSWDTCWKYADLKGLRRRRY